MTSLNDAITLIKTGDKVAGKALLKRYLETEPQNEAAWMWLAVAEEEGHQKIKCLRQVLEINPNNVTARQGLEQLESNETVEMPQLEDILVVPLPLSKLKPLNPINLAEQLEKQTPLKVQSRRKTNISWGILFGSLLLPPLICLASFLVWWGSFPCGWLDTLLARRSGCEYKLHGHFSIAEVAVSSNQATLASIGAFADDKIRLWRVSDGKLLHTLTHKWVKSVTLSPDGGMLASASTIIRLWRTADGILLNTLPEQPFGLTNLAFSLDGTLLASSSTTVRLWRVSDGALLGEMEDYSTRSVDRGLVFSPDGTLLALGGADKRVRLWRVADRKLQHVLQGHTGPIRDVAFSPDGTIVASASTDRTVRLWRVADGTLLHKLDHKYVQVVGFSLDGSILVSAGSDDLRLWRVSDGTLLRTLKYDHGVNIAFSPDQESLLLIGGRGDVRRGQLAK